MAASKAKKPPTYYVIDGTRIYPSAEERFLGYVYIKPGVKAYLIHPSHKMTEWTQEIVQLASTPRFGSIRNCKVCKAEEAKTVAGHKAHDELMQPCKGYPVVY